MCFDVCTKVLPFSCFQCEKQTHGSVLQKKKTLLEYFKETKENTCVRVFFNKIAGCSLATVLTRDSDSEIFVTPGFHEIHVFFKKQRFFKLSLSVTRKCHKLSLKCCLGVA